jgi:thiamine-phosphate pyrophosphorylase
MFDTGAQSGGTRKFRDFRLYVITGEQYHPGRSLREVMEAALKGGADFLQLRDKQASPKSLLEKAKMLRELTWKYDVPFVVNDHIDIALAVGADGVHLGQEDLPLDIARRMLGPDRIIGISTHSIEQAREAQRQGADYIGVGPVFPTATKPGRPAVTTAYVAQVAAEIRIPFVAIGGITPENAGEVLAAGARRICAVSAIVASADPTDVCRRLKALIAAHEQPATAAADPAVRHVQADVGADAPAIWVTINGRKEQTAAQTLRQLAEQLGLADKRVAAEVGGEIVPKDAWNTFRLTEGAAIEFVHFVGGG